MEQFELKIGKKLQNQKQFFEKMNMPNIQQKGKSLKKLKFRLGAIIWRFKQWWKISSLWLWRYMSLKNAMSQS